MKLFINKEISAASEIEKWTFGIDTVSFSDIHGFMDYVNEHYREDNTLDVEIHSCGGDTTEGYAIYDALRTSGKELSCTVVGMAASMATVILLAAPKEKRFAYEHAQLLIHAPYYASTKGEITIERLEQMKGKLEEEREKMLSLYVERTGASRDELSAQMDNGEKFGAERAIELGFVSSVIPATSAKLEQDEIISTTLNEEKMKIKEKGALASAFISLGKVLGIVDDETTLAMSLTTADGTNLEVEREEGNPQVGDKASPDGEHVMEDGRVIVVEDGKITEIRQKEEEAEESDETDGKEDEQKPSASEKFEELLAKMNELSERLAKMKELSERLEAKNKAMEETMSKLSSSYSAIARKTNFKDGEEVEENPFAIEARKIREERKMKYNR